MQLTAITTAQHFIQAFSWMLIHSLWQGLLLSVIVVVLLTACKKASAAVRYNLVLLQLLLFVAACAGTFLWEWCKTPVHYSGISFNGATTGNTVLSYKSFINSCVGYFTANSPVIVLLWFILFLVRTVRIMGSALYINRARHRFVYQPSDAWKVKVNMLCEKLQLKRTVQLLESGYVNVPMVIGHLKPVILIPIGLLAGFPPGQVEAVILHELAHIRRNDYVVNCLQTIVETVFFFNPGLLWISSVLRDERENCCDDIALGQTQNKKEFVQALISFKEYALERKSCAVAFPGNKNSLLNRASRILYDQNKTLGKNEKVFFLAGILVLSIVIATASVAEMHTAAKRRQMVNTLQPPLLSPLPVKEAHNVLKFSRDTLVSKKQVYRLEHVIGAHHGERHSTVANNLNAIKLTIETKKHDVLDEQAKQRDEDSQRKNQEAAMRDKEAAKLDEQAKVRDQEAADRDENTRQNSADQVSTNQPAKKDAGQFNFDYIQSPKAQTVLSKDQEQNIRDQIQAKKDAEQAKIDKKQAAIDEIQAMHDREQYDKDRVRASQEIEKAKTAEQQLRMQKEVDMKMNVTSDVHVQ